MEVSPSRLISCDHAATKPQKKGVLKVKNDELFSSLPFALAVFVSSCVSLSSLFKASLTSFLPSSFLKNLSRET